MNKQKLLHGQIQSPFEKELTELGYIQIKLLSKRLSGIKFDKIYASDLERTEIAANNILKEAEYKIEPILTKLVRERSGGILEGKPIEIKRILANVKK